MNQKHPWWQQCIFIKRFMPEQDGYSYKKIMDELPKLKQAGYDVVQITAPYLSSGFFPGWTAMISTMKLFFSVVGTSC